jgi:hypothetical protein
MIGNIAPQRLDSTTMSTSSSADEETNTKQKQRPSAWNQANMGRKGHCPVVFGSIADTIVASIRITE